MLDTWEGGWDSGSSCWTLGREAGIVDLHVFGNQQFVSDDSFSGVKLRLLVSGMLRRTEILGTVGASYDTEGPQTNTLLSREIPQNTPL